MATTLTARVFIDSFNTGVGRLTVACTESALLGIGLPNCSQGSLLDRLKIDASQSLTHASNDLMWEAGGQLADYAEGRLTAFSLPFELNVCTPFERTILNEVCRVPYGQVRSYGEIARRAGHPRAFRAVGAANARNPLPLLVPCHRIVAAHGLGGYGGGLALKRKLLALEQANNLTTDSLPNQGD